MRWQFLFSFLIFTVSYLAFAQNKIQLSSSYKEPISKGLEGFYKPSEGQMNELLEGNVFALSDVNSPTDKEQQMILFVSGIHPKNCVKAMRKLSLYENYHEYMDFVKSSTYDEKNQKISLVVDHTLLPFPMVVGFKIPRINDEGQYPFLFETGFLKDLKGTIIVKNVAKFCLLGMKVDWRGPETKIPNVVFETFMQTVGKLGLEHLIRVSRI